MKYTCFDDMHSGGFKKTPHETVYVPLPLDQARRVFKNFFGVDSKKTTCNCCGPDFSVFETEKRGEGFYLTKKRYTAEFSEESWNGE
jgi:hypothetical protein